ncbi:MAG: hypothetical protein UV64_C0007G0043 [Parcubacteria group bacterium GW2011_GWC1_43_11b]|nr:MAG: hypothetical protein UV64_C0007G0043 [Parcubacteria group bacterium GW2011_GWC1_43_11b]
MCDCDKTLAIPDVGKPNSKDFLKYCPCACSCHNGNDDMARLCGMDKFKKYLASHPSPPVNLSSIAVVFRWNGAKAYIGPAYHLHRGNWPSYILADYITTA